MESVSAYDTELEAAKERMRGIDESLRSLGAGRLVLASQTQRGRGIRGRLSGPGRGDVHHRLESGGGGGFNRRRISYEDAGSAEPVRKRLRSSLDGRLGRPLGNYQEAAPVDPEEEYEDEEELGWGTRPRPSLQSAVSMPAGASRTRDEAIQEAEAETGKADRARNRRMFGVLLGTLSDFGRSGRDGGAGKQRAKQRAVEEKLEAEQTRERSEREAEKSELLAKRQEEEEEIIRLQRRKTLTFIAEKEMEHLRLLQPFIQTKARPPLFYRPKIHSLRTIELQKKTERKFQERIDERAEQLAKDLELIDEKNALYKSRIVGLKRDGDGEVGEAKEESGEMIDGDAAELKEAGDSQAEPDQDDGAEECREDEGDAIIGQINAEPDSSQQPPEPRESEQPANSTESGE